MPRNSQVTRILYVLRSLEAPQGATLQELAAALPEDAPKHPRTLRRDLQALESLGFPAYTERAGGEVRWKLLEGFRRIPAPPFAPTELMALVFSRQLLAPLDGTEVHAALDGALAKVAETPEVVGWILSFAGGARVVAPASLREAVRQAAEWIVYNSL